MVGAFLTLHDPSCTLLSKHEHKGEIMKRTERLNMTLDKELNEVIERYAEAVGQTKSTAVYLLLRDVKPILENLTEEINQFHKMVDGGADPKTQYEILEQRSLANGITQIIRKMKEI